MCACASSVRHSAPLLSRQSNYQEKEVGGKDVRYHAATLGLYLLVVRRRQLRFLAGHPGAGLIQSERDVPRGGGVDGGHPTHTGGSC